jgi:hypothetical protein
MPGTVNQDDLMYSGQIVSRFVHGSGINKCYTSRFDLLDQSGRRIYAIPTDLLGSTSQDVNHQAPGIGSFVKLFEMGQQCDFHAMDILPCD